MMLTLGGRRSVRPRRSVARHPRPRQSVREPLLRCGGLESRADEDLVYRGESDDRGSRAGDLRSESLKRGGGSGEIAGYRCAGRVDSGSSLRPEVESGRAGHVRRRRSVPRYRIARRTYRP